MGQLVSRPKSAPHGRRFLSVSAALLVLGGVATGAVYIGGKRAIVERVPLPLLSTEGARAGGVLLIGDSRMARWPRELLPARAMVAGYPGAAAVNIGPTMSAYMAAVRPRTVVIQAGYNDAVAAALHLPGEREAILAEASRSVRDMIAAAKRGGAARIVLLTVAPPMQPDLAWRLVYATRVQGIVAGLNARLEAEKFEGVELVDLAALFGQPGGAIDPRFADGNSHFSRAAYRVLAARIFPDAPAAAVPPGGERR